MKDNAHFSPRKVFGQAVDALKVGTSFCSDHSHKIAAAFSVQSPLEHKYYHGAKLAGMSAIALVSAFTLNVEGLVGAGFATADEIATLEKAGNYTLTHMPQ